jgi:two-component system, chemotaxis family, protein-glutamate methylesterase/glutaminase
LADGDRERVDLHGRDIIAIGGSAGGIEAVQTLLGGLPKDFPAAIFVVIHIPAGPTSVLPKIFDRAGPLAAGHFSDGERIKAGRVYVAPPDRHLIVDRGTVRHSRGPKENRHRPAVDTLFASAARSYGSRAVGVVLTGALDDGTAGLIQIKKGGGVAVVQDPEEAPHPGMPESALRNVEVDHRLALSEMPSLLIRLAKERVEEGDEDLVSERDEDFAANPGKMESLGAPSALSCPECGGPLWDIGDGGFDRFRCRVGHAYTAEHLISEQDGEIEDALYCAVNTLHENALVSEQLATRARERGNNTSAKHFERRAEEARRKASVILRALS